MADQTSVEISGEKGFSKGSFRPSLVPAAWISGTNEIAELPAGDTHSTVDYASDSERKEQNSALEAEDSVEFGPLSPDVCNPEQTEADIRCFFMGNDAVGTPFPHFQDTAGSQRNGFASVGPDDTNGSDDDRTPFTKLYIGESSDQKKSSPRGDFLRELDDIPPSNSAILAGVQEDEAESLGIKRDANTVTADEVRDAVRCVLENDQDMLNSSTKQWMVVVAGHLGLENLPKIWKSTLKDALLELAEVALTQPTQVVPVSPGFNAEVVYDVEDDDNSPRKTSRVTVLPPPDSDDDVGASDSDLDGLDSGDEMVAAQGQERGVQEETVRASKFRMKYDKGGDKGDRKGAAKKNDEGEEGEENEELKVVKALEVITERQQHLMDLLHRDTDLLEQKAEEMRAALMEKVKSKVTPTVQQFCAEVQSLKKYKSALRETGLMDAFVILAGEKGLKVDVDDDSEDSGQDDDGGDEVEERPAQQQQQRGAQEEEFIEFSDEDDEHSDSDDRNEISSFVPEVMDVLPNSPASGNHKRQGISSTISSSTAISSTSALKTLPLFGGHCQSVFKVRASTARTKMKTELQQKTRLQSSESVAKKFGLASADHLVKVLGGIELERRRVAAERAAKEAEQREKEAKVAAERKERARKYEEELLRKAADADSDGELDDDDEAFVRGVEMPVGDSSVGMAAVDLDLDDVDGEEEESEEEDVDEEEALLALQERERVELERAERMAASSLNEKEESSHEDADSINAEDKADGDDDDNDGDDPAKQRGISVRESDINNDEAETDQSGENAVDGDTDTHAQESEVDTSIQRPARVSDGVTQEGSELEDNVGKQSIVNKMKKSKQPKNAAYLQMLKAEEVKARKSKSGKLVEGEAEEEEEVGRQAGLGDYFFGVPKSADDDERDALKLRAGDLEHIVDDVSDGEGDEAMGRAQRMEDEARQDRLKTKKILESLASGHQSARQKQSAGGLRGHYGLDELAADGITSATGAAGAGDEEELGELNDADFDDDEELQASYLSKMTSRVRGQKEESQAMDELTDDDDDDASDEEGSGGGSNMTEAERRENAQRKAIEKEVYKRFYDQACRNKALRKDRKKGHGSDGAGALEAPVLLPKLSLLSAPVVSPTTAEGGFGPSPAVTAGTPKDTSRQAAPVLTVHRPESRQSGSSTSPVHSEMSGRGHGDPFFSGEEVNMLEDLTEHPPLDSHTSESSVKRRTSLVPQKVDVNAFKSRHHGGARGSKLRRVNTIAGSASQVTSARGPSGGSGNRVAVLNGVLNREELEAGVGMFMGVSTAARRKKALLDSSPDDGVGGHGGSALSTHSSLPDGSSSLFSIVTSAGAPSLKRSYSSISSNRSKAILQGCGPVTVSKEQFVFQSGHSRTATGLGGDELSNVDSSNITYDAANSMRDASSRSNISNSKKRFRPSEATSIRPTPSPANMKRSRTLPTGSGTNGGGTTGGGGDSALFAKLAGRTGPISSSRSMSSRAR